MALPAGRTGSRLSGEREKMFKVQSFRFLDTQYLYLFPCKKLTKLCNPTTLTFGFAGNANITAMQN